MVSYKFGSDGWAKAFGKAINENPAYKEAASWWEGDFIFIVQPSGNLKEEIKMFVGLLKGVCTGAGALKPGQKYEVVKPNGKPVPFKEGVTPAAEFIFSGTYDNWIKVLKKELDPIQGLMSGKFKLVGNMTKVMRATKAAQELVNSTTKVPTEFY